MIPHTLPRRFGFAIIEALIALLLVGIGLLAVSRLQTLGLVGSGEAKSRTEAAHLSQRKIEELRNIVLRSGFTALANGTATETGNNAQYAMAWTVTTPNASLEQRLVRLTTTWTDASGRSQRLDLNTLIAWDDPGLQARFSTNPSQTLIQPTGEAQRGSGPLPGWDPNSPQGTANADGSRIYTDPNTKKTYLLSSSGQILLTLPPKNGSAQSFTTISGRVMFDQSVNSGSIPASNYVRVRLSSEGECVFDNRVAQLQITSGNGFKFFRYTCYVGPGWYGNVAVTVDDAVNGQAASPTVCVGDPAFNNGVSNSTLVSAHPFESSVRSYRGFRSGGNGLYLATGVAGNRKYGQSFASNGTAITGPFDGTPKPSSYPSFYPGVATADNYFNQDFLVTRLSGNSSCAGKMAGGQFTRNAGAFLCINPDVYGDTDICPAIWPGFETLVGNGGSINFGVGVTLAGSGSGTVTSSVGGISCGSLCATSVPTGTTLTLTATAASGSVFTGWTGCGSVSGNVCTVTVNSGVSVTASFDSAAAVLTVATSGSGSGSVASSDSRIACSSGGAGTCSANYASNTAVTLTATAANGGSFTGWSGGGCSGTGTCTVTMDQSKTVTAGFAPPVGNELSVTVAGSSGSVVSAPSGINCSSGTCSATYGTSTTVVLTATPANGSTFGGWTGACSGTGTCSVTMSQARSVTATFSTPVTTNVLSVTKAGTGNGTVVSSPAGISCSTGTCTASFNSATSVTLSATAAGGSTFSGWSGACSGTGDCTVAMSQARSVTATFALNATCTTPVSGTAADKNGDVTASPSTFGTCTMAGGNSANYSCSFSAPSGTVIALTNSRTNGNPQFSYTKSITANCTAQTNVNFP